MPVGLRGRVQLLEPPGQTCWLPWLRVCFLHRNDPKGAELTRFSVRLGPELFLPPMVLHQVFLVVPEPLLQGLRGLRGPLGDPSRTGSDVGRPLPDLGLPLQGPELDLQLLQPPVLLQNLPEGLLLGAVQRVRVGGPSGLRGGPGRRRPGPARSSPLGARGGTRSGDSPMRLRRAGRGPPPRGSARSSAGRSGPPRPAGPAGSGAAGAGRSPPAASPGRAASPGGCSGPSGLHTEQMDEGGGAPSALC